METRNVLDCNKSNVYSAHTKRRYYTTTTTATTTTVLLPLQLQLKIRDMSFTEVEL